MRTIVRDFADACSVAIVSGRDRADVERLIGLGDPVYAGSHGVDIAGTEGLRSQHEEGAAFAAAVWRAADRLREVLAPVKGALVDPERFAVAVHYRQVAAEPVPAVEVAVNDILDEVPQLRKTFGKKAFKRRPRLDWDKGKAAPWLRHALGLGGPEVLPLCLDDDREQWEHATDADALPTEGLAPPWLDSP